MGKEKRLAVSKKLSFEDLVIGTFVLLALLYPLGITLFIYTQEKREKTSELNLMRATYMFLLGLEDCSPQRAIEIADLFERKLLQRLGGVPGLVKRCINNSVKLRGGIRLSEEVERVGRVLSVVVVITKKEKGLPRKVAKMELFGLSNEKGFKITDISDVKGN